MTPKEQAIEQFKHLMTEADAFASSATGVIPSDIVKWHEMTLKAFIDGYDVVQKNGIRFLVQLEGLQACYIKGLLAAFESNQPFDPSRN